MHAALAKRWDVSVLIESRPTRASQARRRVRTQGLGAVLGQAAFLFAIRPALARAARRRKQEIFREQGWVAAPFPSDARHFDSVNDDDARAWLRDADPAAVVLNGTRIVGRATLGCVRAPFLNMHAGITPHYRGVHGAYWALRDGRPDRCGVTVHVVDEGIDTGAILGQALIHPTPLDNFTTYPFLQLAAGLPLLVGSVEDALAGKLSTPPPRGAIPPRSLHSHPTAWGYVRSRATRGVR